MIAAAVWFHLERGVDITDIVRFFYPEYEFPDTLYRFYDKEHVDEKMQKAIRMTVIPASGDPSLGQQPFLRVSLQALPGDAIFRRSFVDAYFRCAIKSSV